MKFFLAESLYAPSLGRRDFRPGFWLVPAQLTPALLGPACTHQLPAPFKLVIIRNFLSSIYGSLGHNGHPEQTVVVPHLHPGVGFATAVDKSRIVPPSCRIYVLSTAWDVHEVAMRWGRPFGAGAVHCGQFSLPLLMLLLCYNLPEIFLYIISFGNICSCPQPASLASSLEDLHWGWAGKPSVGARRVNTVSAVTKYLLALVLTCKKCVVVVFECNGVHLHPCMQVLSPCAGQTHKEISSASLAARSPSSSAWAFFDTMSVSIVSYCS